MNRPLLSHVSGSFTDLTDITPIKDFCGHQTSVMNGTSLMIIQSLILITSRFLSSTSYVTLMASLLMSISSCQRYLEILLKAGILSKISSHLIHKTLWLLTPGLALYVEPSTQIMKITPAATWAALDLLLIYLLSTLIIML